MKITNNVQALKAYTSLSLNQASMKKTMDRLSSGVRINKASDDAAGLAISEKMRMRLDSLSMAERNTLDGISLTQTLEGGMNETLVPKLVDPVAYRWSNLSRRTAARTIPQPGRGYVDYGTDIGPGQQ